MKLMRQFSIIVLMLVTSVTMPLAPLTVAAEALFEEVSTEDLLYVRGLISRVYPEKMQISVRPPKSKLVRISIDADTILEGVSQIGDFEKEQQVKIWYSPENEKNRAIKIKKMMDLGC